MTEFPLLCRSPYCRPADHGGPRRTERAWFCPVCVDRMRSQLESIAAAWPDLQDSLGASERVSSAEQGHQKNGGKSHGTALNERVSDAMRAASLLVWAMTRILLDDYDEEGRVLPVPKVQDTPTLAAWLAKLHVGHFASHPGDNLALETLEDIRTAHRNVMAAAYPKGGRKVETGLPCDQHGTSTMGERVPCEGTMVAYVAPGMSWTPDLVCTVDPQHRLTPDVWQRPGWKRAHERMDPAGVRALVGRIKA